MKSQEAWLQWLESRCAHQPIQLGLTRVKKIAARLNVTHFDVPVLIVGGTNGKGSTVHALQAIYRKAGYRVATYTSPHLLAFNERICVDGKQIEEVALCEAFQAVREAEQHSTLTYFEFTTLAAFWYFKHVHPDVIILEVGLGGRLDATNLIDADLAILTTIDFDHQAYLGDTLDAIGFEKAGIFRHRQQAVFASPRPPQSVLSVANQLSTALSCYQKDYQDQCDESANTYTFKTAHFEWTGKLPSLHHQAVSAAMMATRLLYEKLPIPVSAYDALSHAQLAGRLQYIPGEVDVLIDVSHNLQSVNRLSEHLKRHFSGRKIHALFSALSDKPIAAMVARLACQVDCWHIAPLTGERAATLATLKQACRNSPEQLIVWYNDLNLAYDGAHTQVAAGDVLVVFGSFLTVANYLTYTQRQ